MDKFPLDADAHRAQRKRAMGAIHVIYCPECQLELCADPSCNVHPSERWVSLHAEEHYTAMTALLLGQQVLDSGTRSGGHGSEPVRAAFTESASERTRGRYHRGRR